MEGCFSRKLYVKMIVKYHIQQQHAPDCKNDCDTCSSELASKSETDSHIEKVHSQTCPQNCITCGK